MLAKPENAKKSILVRTPITRGFLEIIVMGGPAPEGMRQN
jgi:hypothetical protein